ncbi:MAG: molybdate ABC transporter substrate-binding protein [Alphaproteobacteria bacterium]|nr:molybdate ABC transporter substrate-binding protein [Alphaproteobacteria bacterium]
MKYVLALLATCILALAPAAGAAQAARPVVFAAASLKGPLDEAAAAFRAESGVEVTISYAGSNALAKQIEEGAPAEIFISADEDWMNALQEKGLIRPETRIDLLANELALIAPVASTLSLTPAAGFPIAAALGEGKLAMADPDAVPAGKYGKAALTALGVWDGVAANVARTENVRAALAFVAAGEASLGIVYVTDAKAEPRVKTLGVFPASSHDPILYPAALTRTATAASAQFLAYLRAEAATAIFAGAGFGKPAR